MKTIEVERKAYHLPSMLNDFQMEMYIHLINWKWNHITLEPGLDRDIHYDAIIPDRYTDQMPTLYPNLKDVLEKHQEKYPYRMHKFFNHMASSQAANFNLFLPILMNPQAAAIFSEIRPDFSRLATEQLDRGFRIEFWDEPYGTLRDKSPISGTDADIAIAYYNQEDELSLWLIEHKLTESEFTTCGGYRSHGRRLTHNCQYSFSNILINKDTCYYHDIKKFAYWEITERNQDFFVNHADFVQCPFQGGLNQLWRNQILGLSIEQDPHQPYKHVTFSVAHHPRNVSLKTSIESYKHLISDNPKFSTFTSEEVLNSAARLHDPSLDHWITWYRELYNL